MGSFILVYKNSDYQTTIKNFFQTITAILAINASKSQIVRKMWQMWCVCSTASFI